MAADYQNSMISSGVITEQGGSKLYLYLSVLVATVGGFLFGYDTLIISGAVIFLRDHFALSPAAIGFAGSSIIIGCLIGTLIVGSVSDRLGRKRSLILAALLFGLSALGTALPRTFLEFSIFRILGGVGMGVAMVISPVYIAEIAPAKIRGFLVTLNQFVIVSGALGAIVVGYMLSFEGRWRWMFASEFVPAALLLAGVLLVPESPRWLVERNRLDEALGILTRINGRQQAESELKEIRASIAMEEESSYSELFRSGVRFALVIALGLAALQQFSGGMPLSMYAPLIFQKAGFASAPDAIGLTVLLFVWSLICVVIVLWLVERVGRRPLLLVGLAGMAAGHFALSLSFHYGMKGIFVPVLLMLTTGMSNISISQLAWVVLAEIFPTRIRGRAMSLATFVLFLSSFANNQFFPSLKAYSEEHFGSPSAVFLVFGAVCSLGVLFVWRTVPETKGKTLEEIARFWLSRQEMARR